MSNYTPPPEYEFRSSIERPGGIRVECVITVPQAEAHADILEASELSQMAALRGLNLLLQSQEAAARRAAEDKNQVPF